MIVRGIAIESGVVTVFEDVQEVAYFTEFGTFSTVNAAVADIKARVADVAPDFDPDFDPDFRVTDVELVGGFPVPVFA